MFPYHGLMFLAGAMTSVENVAFFSAYWVLTRPAYIIHDILIRYIPNELSKFGFRHHVILLLLSVTVAIGAYFFMFILNEFLYDGKYPFNSRDPWLIGGLSFVVLHMSYFKSRVSYILSQDRLRIYAILDLVFVVGVIIFSLVAKNINLLFLALIIEAVRWMILIVISFRATELRTSANGL
jgi:hypothetical protein